jgi:hypothetical protein
MDTNMLNRGKRDEHNKKKNVENKYTSESWKGVIHATSDCALYLPDFHFPICLVASQYIAERDSQHL